VQAAGDVHGRGREAVLPTPRPIPDHGGGRIELLPLGQAFGDWEGTIWFGEDADETRRLYPVDFFQA
jgi:hypothetical protein